MPEWWTYTVSDFLMFSPRTYYRLLERYNLSIWPAHVLALGLGIAILALSYRGGAQRGRLIAAILAAGWLWVAWAFHFQRYATINWAAVHFAAGFSLEAVLLIWAGVIRNRLLPETATAGLGIFLVGLVAYPLIDPLLGRPWDQAEVFGVAPDPTVIATLGMLLACPKAPRLLLAIPVLWCGVSGATLWAMKAPEALLSPLIALLVMLRLRNRSRA